MPIPIATSLGGRLASTVVAGLTVTAAVATVGTDPTEIVYTTELKDARVVDYKAEELDRDAFGELSDEDRDVARKNKADEQTPKPTDPGLIGPALLKLLGSEDPSKPVEVVITRRDELTIPPFPQPDDTESRETSANRQALAQARKMVDELTAQRAEGYDELGKRLAELDGKLGTTFWLIDGATATIPLGAVEKIAEQWDDLQYVQLADPFPIRPPVDGDPDNDIRDGRARISSDPYFNLGQTQGWIGLLDSGVRSDHTLLSGPDRIALEMDLTGDGDPGDNCDSWNGHGHGTATAAILTGNSNLGFDHRGVSGVRVDSFDVYGDNCSLDVSAAVDGFQTGVMWLDRVIVGEIQHDAAETGAIATAADAAFDAGVVVVAANGNAGPGAGTVRSPGNAHKALGIGADHVKTSVLEGYSGRGPTNDSRVKPDLVAPTDTESASTSGVAATFDFNGTSGATPYAAGAAALVRNWLQPLGSFDPGHVYARMILYGQEAYPFDNNTGAGDLIMGTGGTVHYGKVNVSDGQTIDIPVSVSPNRDTIEAALWWPESTAVHNDVDLQLIAPNGAVADLSVSSPSVFERAGVVGSAASGQWTIRISGYDVSSVQTVYWSVRTR